MRKRAAPLRLTGVSPRNLALARALRVWEHVVVNVGHKDGVHMRDYCSVLCPQAAAVTIAYGLLVSR